MQEAVDNLVKNALDHTKSGDTIQVEWNALPSMVQIKVCDNGSGIHPEDLYHMPDHTTHEPYQNVLCTREIPEKPREFLLRWNLDMV